MIAGVAGSASAGVYQACQAGNVTVPCETSAWDIGADALVLNAREGELQGGANNDADWGWGFRIEGSYHFGTGNDFNLNWAHYDKTTTHVDSAGDHGGDVAVTGAIDYNSRFDIVNLEFGQQVDFGEKWDMRFHGGIQYANLQNQISAAPGLLTNGTNTLRVTGWGPRAGVDMSYLYGNGFSVFGDASLSVLTASERLSGTTGANAAGNFFGGASAGTRNSMITATESKIGVKYTRAVSQGDLTFRVGWETHNFINARLGTGNLAWDGVFFGLKWLGNA